MAKSLALVILYFTWIVVAAKRDNRYNFTTPCLLNEKANKTTLSQQWAGLIYRKEFTAIRHALNSCKADQHKAQLLFGEAVALAYDGKLETLSSTLDFIQSLGVHSFTIYAHERLLKEVEKVNRKYSMEMMYLAYYISKAMNETNEEKANAKYIKLKSEIPTVIRAVIFKDEVTIKSRRYELFMYEMGGSLVGGNRIQLLYILGIPSYRNYYFEPRMEYGQLYYILRNHGYDNWRVCVGSKFSEDSRHTISSPGESERNDTKWFLEPNDEEYFTIRSWDRAYLYASDKLYNAERRHVGTWIGEPRDISRNQESHWIISPN